MVDRTYEWRIRDSVNHRDIYETSVSNIGIVVKNAPGPDNIPSMFLKQNVEITAKFLTVIFYVSLSSGAGPEDWLTARVALVLKKSDPSLQASYRLIYHSHV